MQVSGAWGDGGHGEVSVLVGKWGIEGYMGIRYKV
jgi:hypothetical protein